MNTITLQNFVAVALAITFVLTPQSTQAEVDAYLKRRADAVVGLMSFMLTPDVTTGSLSFSDQTAGNPDIALTTLGGGFTVSQDIPLYLEGTAGYSRYDPSFLVSDGEIVRPVPAKWNSATLTGGIGWDFTIVKELRFRPIFNFSYGRVASDSSVAAAILENQTDVNLDFLKNRTSEVYGLGGTLMLDYERYSDKNEIDIELRYTNIQLQSFSNAPAAVQGSSDAQSLSLWSRWRAPTSFTALNKPVRYVIEVARTSYFGDMRGALGFDALNSIGVGLELDSSAYDSIITRTRLVVRYQFGENIEGTSMGFAINF